MEKEILENTPESMQTVLGKIMTAEEYSHLKHQTPYIFGLRKGDKALDYFGSRHIRDPKDPMFTDIELIFNQLNPEVVFVEGIDERKKDFYTEKVKNLSREEAIDQMGEAGFTLKLATEKGIDWYSPEPLNEELHAKLLTQGFSREQIAAWNVLQMWPQYQRQLEKVGFKNYVVGAISQLEEATHWSGFDYSYESALKTAEAIIGRSIDVENDTDGINLIDPIPWERMKDKQTIFNRISEASSMIRDREIVCRLVEAFKNHQRVFVVYGASHAVMQEPALRYFFSNDFLF